MKRTLVVLMSLVVLLWGCAAEAEPSMTHRHGDVLDPGSRPDPADCDARIRGDVAAAQRIRRDAGIEGVDADLQSARIAAADPAATTNQLGIPLTPVESGLVAESGITLDHPAPIAFWVSSGAPETFGGYWLGDSGGSVVGIVRGDRDSLALARCLDDANVTYVWADRSEAEGTAVVRRITADVNFLRAEGIDLRVAYYDIISGVTVVGVTTVIPGMAERLAERYGVPIRLEETGPVVPL